MTYIRCPHCGAKALNVATMCPQCRAPLSQNPMEAGRHGLDACRRCRKFIERDAEICPFCGYHVRRGRTLRRWTGGTLAVVVVLALAGYGWWAAGGVEGVRGWFSTPAAVPVAADPAPAAPPIPDDTTATLEAEPIVAAPPAAAPPVSRRAPPAALAVRYARNWANVRSGRSTDSAVVAILRPGDRVQVSDLASGWWAVWSDSTRVGFVATDLLGTSPLPRDSTSGGAR